MKALALVVLALAVVAGVFCWREAEGQSLPFAIQQQGCADCSDTTLDSIDNQWFFAEGNLSGRPFQWVSPYPADIGVRRMRLTVTAQAAAVYLIANPSVQSIGVFFGQTKTLCLAAYGGAKAAVVVKGSGFASVEFMDGDGGCSPEEQY